MGQFFIDVAAELCWLPGYILGFFVQKFAKRNTQGCPDREMHMRVNDLWRVVFFFGFFLLGQTLVSMCKLKMERDV
jgi:hypothetical protein